MKKIRKTKRTFGFACVTMCVIIIMKEFYSIIYSDTIANYYSHVGNALPSAEDPSFAPKDKSLFFHETSFNGELTPREACSVEAAARAHPKREIYVMFTAPVTEYELKTTCLAQLLRFHNVKFLRVNISEYSKGTVVQRIFLKDLKKSRFPVQHTADILKILTLSKWGGISLNTDMVVIKSLEELALNWIVKQGEKFVAPEMFAFGKDAIGRNVTSAILKEIFETYNPNDRYATGAKIIKKVIQRVCPIKIRWDSCPGIEIYKHQLFYPIDKVTWNAHHKIKHNQLSYSFRWNFRRPGRSVYTIVMPNEKLARRYCPSIFQSYQEELLNA